MQVSPAVGVNKHIGFTEGVPSSRVLIGPGSRLKSFQIAITPPPFTSELLQHTRPHTVKLLKNRSLTASKAAKYRKMSLHFNDNINSFNCCFHNVNTNITVINENWEIMAWLSPLEPLRRHHDIRNRRVDEVGDWLLQTKEYRNWVDGIGSGSSGSALFCYGGPGVGKTYIR